MPSSLAFTIFRLLSTVASVLAGPRCVEWELQKDLRSSVSGLLFFLLGVQVCQCRSAFLL